MFVKVLSDDAFETAQAYDISNPYLTFWSYRTDSYIALRPRKFRIEMEAIEQTNLQNVSPLFTAHR
jgi:hypothetical protein